MIRWILVAVSALVIYGTVCPMIRTTRWWVRVMDFPRIQFAWLAIGTVVGLYLAMPTTHRSRWIALMVVVAATLLVQIPRIFPFTKFADPEVPDLAPDQLHGDSLRIIAGNLDFENGDPAPTLKLLQERAADLVFLVEVDDDWARHLKVLEAQYPHHVVHPRPKGRGLAIYSRFELVNPQIRHLVTEERPSLRTDVQLPSGREVRFWGLHPAPPGLEERDAEGRKSSHERDTELILVAREVREGEQPSLVVGDFNDAAWSHTTRRFKDVSGMRDPRVGRGRFNTYHADWFFLRYPIDHMFVSNEFRLLELEKLPSINSDHFPMWMSVGLPAPKDPSAELAG